MIQNQLNYQLVYLCNIATNVQMSLHNYHYIIYNGITISISLQLSIISVLLISLIQLVNGAQFLNATPLFLSSACLVAASSPAPVNVIFPLTRIF